jgi:hypothetical protein
MRDMTPRTVYGAVDLAPLLRRMDGEDAPRVPKWERPAAAAALTDMGLGVHQIAGLLRIDGADASELVRDYKRRRDSYRATEHLVTERAIQIVRWREHERDRLREAGKKARTRRLAERVQVDSFLFHPRAPHGTNTGYNAYGCRCPGPEGCREAHAQVQRERRAAA